MKRFVVLLVLAAVFCSLTLRAQKIGYMNTETILSKIPEYAAAQEQLEKLNDQYKSRIENDYKDIERLYQSYQSSKASLSEYQRSQRESEIISKERAVKELQKTYFGPDGYMQKKTEELLTPIRNKVQGAIDKIAKEEGFMLIFDLAALQGVVYDNPQYDLSARILTMLNY